MPSICATTRLPRQSEHASFSQGSPSHVFDWKRRSGRDKRSSLPARRLLRSAWWLTQTLYNDAALRVVRRAALRLSSDELIAIRLASTLDTSPAWCGKGACARTPGCPGE